MVRLVRRQEFELVLDAFKSLFRCHDFHYTLPLLSF